MFRRQKRGLLPYCIDRHISCQLTTSLRDAHRTDGDAFRILDEITTHLDAPTILALVSALRGWKGAVVLITHDRWFHKVLIEGMAIEGDDESEMKEAKVGKTYMVDKGRVREMEGGMEEYERLIQKRMKRALG